MEIIKAIILGLIQGITEWLPISSTGHLVLTDYILNLNFSKDFVNTFFVVIQLGSIMAVVILFFNKLNPFSLKKNKEEKKNTINLWFKIAIGSIPAAIIGFLFEEQIDNVLYKPIPIAIALIIYGIIFIIIEKIVKKPKVDSLNEITYKKAFIIGLFQSLALIPGTSRSGSTIIGSMLFGTSRYVASEFSFFLAIPVMFGASFYKLLKIGFDFTHLEFMVLLTGSVVAFVTSLWVIRFLLEYVKKHDFKIFGYYRIILGLIIIALLLF